MAFIDSVPGDGIDDIANHQRRAGSEVMGEHIQLIHHIQLPDDIEIGFPGIFLILVGPVILSVEEALGIDAHHLAAIGDIPHPVPFHITGRTNPLQRPVIHDAGGQFEMRCLPEKFSVAFPEHQDVAAVAGQLRIA